MKRYVLSLLIVFLFSGVATAQKTFTAGEISLGVNASVASDLHKSNAFSIGLSGGWHFNERWEAGVSLGYAQRGDNVVALADNSLTLQKNLKGIIASLYAACYWNIAPGFYFDLRGTVAFRFDRYVAQPVFGLSNGSNVRENEVGIMLSPGLTYLINRRLQLGMTLGGLSWNSGRSKSNDASYGSKNSNTIVLDWNSGLSFALGFRF